MFKLNITGTKRKDWQEPIKSKGKEIVLMKRKSSAKKKDDIIYVMG